MQINLTATILKTMVKGFSKVVSGRTTLPVLGHVAFRHDPEANTTTATVTNLDETLTFKLPPECVMPGTGSPDAFLCPFGELRGLAGSLAAKASVLLTPEGDTSVVAGTRCDDSLVQREFASMPVGEFPSFPEPIDCTPADIGSFLEGYRTVLPSSSPEDARAVLHGVFYDHKESCMVATDSRRLMVMPITRLPVSGDLILPQSRVLANGILGGTAGGSMGVEVSKDGGRPRLELHAGPWTYCVKGIEGNYPNYRQVIPPATSRWQGHFRFHPEDLALLKLTVRQFTDAEHGGIGLVTDGIRTIVIKSEVNSDGKASYVVLPRCDGEVTAPILIGVNAEFFMDGIAAGCLRVRYQDGYSPLRCENPNTGALYILMPLREHSLAVTKFVAETFKVSGLVAAAPANPSETTTVPEPATDKENTDMSKNSMPATSESTTATMPPSGPAPLTSETGLQSEVAGPVTAVAGVSADGALVTPGTPTAESTAGAGAALQFVLPDNPEDALIDGIQTLHEKVTDVLNELRTLKQKARAVEKHYRTKARDIDSKAQLITKFQKAVGF